MRRILFLLVALGLLTACEATKPTSVWGGPYTARSWGGQDHPEIEATWVDGSLEITGLPLEYGITFSLEFDPGTYEFSKECTLHPDFEMNGHGDTNPPLPVGTTSVVFEDKGWGLLSIPAGVADCAFRRVPE
jgi:hypothetical protein